MDSKEKKELLKDIKKLKKRITKREASELKNSLNGSGGFVWVF